MNGQGRRRSRRLTIRARLSFKWSVPVRNSPIVHPHAQVDAPSPPESAVPRRSRGARGPASRTRHRLPHRHLDPHGLAGELSGQPRNRTRLRRRSGSRSAAATRRRSSIPVTRSSSTSPGCERSRGIARVRSRMFEDRTPIWPLGRKRHPEDYPWRVEAEPVAVLDEDAFVPAESLVGALEHVRKWPAEHWHLAFQGQLRGLRGRCRAASRPDRGCRTHRSTGQVIGRHFTVEEANALLGRIEPVLRSPARGARPAHRCRGARGARRCAPTNGGGDPGRNVGAFLEVRRMLLALQGFPGSSSATSSAA